MGELNTAILRLSTPPEAMAQVRHIGITVDVTEEKLFTMEKLHYTLSIIPSYVHNFESLTTFF
jgi:hypothetical protein